eukprot:NODE_235_length_11996_cov_1.212070.p3 type:complete len:194 gc:universal NODE_235_length_11996_cov_1.212070:1393-1974(+)
MSHSYERLHESTNVNFLLKHINTTFQLYLNLGNEYAVDESMALCKCKCYFAKKMKSKPINLGLRNFMICCSSSNMCPGILLDNKERHITAPALFIESLFVKLLQIVPNSQQSLIVADNYYNSSSIVNMLLNTYSIYCRGTLRKNKVPDDMEIGNLKTMAYGVEVTQVINLPFCHYSGDQFDVFFCRDITEFMS